MAISSAEFRHDRSKSLSGDSEDWADAASNPFESLTSLENGSSTTQESGPLAVAQIVIILFVLRANNYNLFITNNVDGADIFSPEPLRPPQNKSSTNSTICSCDHLLTPLKFTLEDVGIIRTANKNSMGPSPPNTQCIKVGRDRRVGFNTGSGYWYEEFGS